MNLDSLSFALSEISYSVANLSKKSYKSSVTEISHLLSRHGAEADRHLFRCLFSHVDFGGDGHISGKDTYQIQYLTQECSALIAKPNFVSILCSAIDNPLHHQKSIKPSPHLLLQLSKVLKLNKIQEVCFGLALLNSANSDTRSSATSFTRSRLPQLISTYLDTEAVGNLERGLQDLSAEVLHLILTHLTAENNNFGLKQEQKDNFVAKLKTEFPKERAPVILAPLLYTETEDLALEQLNPDALTTPTGIMATSLADTVREIGYGFTSSVEECRNDLRQLGVREITPPSIARVLGMMAKTPVGLSDPISVQALGAANNQWLDLKEGGSEGGPQAWNVEVFVQAVKDLAPHLQWREVIAELDHPGFLILSKAGLRLIVQALFRGVSDNFPIDLVYKPWKNTEGQLAFIAHAIKNPDVFCFADYPCHAVNLEQLKTPPDEENRDIATWKSLDLVETLLRLSEAGHYAPVSELFKFPVQHCPDLFVFSLLQIPTWNRMKHELLTLLMPVFLGNHPNSGNVLNYAWHIQGQSTTIRTLIMHTMAEWYMRGDIHDQTRLSRILDVAQDLKALSMLLSASPFAFVIDLACLASRREYLKLEKWLTDKIREHGEPFIQECVLFLKRRCPQIMPNGPLKDEAIKGTPLPTDVIGTILRCLQASYNQSLSQELQEAIMNMLHSAPSLMAARGPPQGPSGPIQGNPAQHKSGLPGLPNTSTQGGTSIGGNPMDPLASLTQVGSNGPIGPGGPTAQQGLPSSLSNSLPGAPGSPAKAFPTMGNPVGQLTQQFNPVQSLASQLQNMNMNTTMNSGLGNNMASQGLGGNLGGLGGNMPGQSLTSGLGANMTSLTTPGLTGGLGGNMATQGLAGGLGNNMASQGLAAGIGGNMPTSGLSSSGTGGQGSVSGTPTKNNPFQAGLNLGGGGGLGALGPSVGSLAPQAPAQSRIPPDIQSLHDRLNAQKNKTSLGAPSTTQAPPTSVGGVGGGDVSNIFPAMNQQFPKEIEDEANSYFQRIYNHAAVQLTISIDEVLDMLRRFKDSPQKKERDVFACMLRNLFEEYRFFPQYPDKELHTTAVLFGGIIEQGLVTYMDLGIALRYVLEALKKPHGSKMYYFGIAALDRFKTRLKDYPQYCQHLASIPHFTQFPQHLKEYIDFGARSQEPPNRPQGSVPSPIPTPAPPIAVTASTVVSSGVGVTPASTTATSTTATTTTTASHGAIARPGGSVTGRTSIATATNIDTLIAGQEGLNEEVTVPPESVQDKVFFIFNNLSIANMDQKAKELKESMEESMYPWAGQYLVMKRASIEHNFHTLYAKFIDHLKLNNFLQLVVDETFRNIRVLLRSDKGVANFSDRSLLKNLGHWLGMLTLAKNRPILHQDIDLKSLLYESYHKGAQELLYVVPFVAKVLESCAQSKVFKPLNPWTMGIMNVLAELHQVPDLKLNLKFEIEVLCKNLIIDINDLNPGSYLMDEERLTRLENQLSAPRKGPETSTPQPEEPLQINMPTPTTTVAASTPAQTVTTTSTTTTSSIVPPTPQFGYHEINVLSLSGLAPHITVNETMVLLQGQPQLKQLIRPAIERSVQDLLPPVVERSIKIALTTCEQIVKKDFALDPEENRMCVAAHNMVRFMTSGMALITCREPLLVSITNNIKQAFLNTLRGTNQAQKDMIEAAATSIAQDNVDLACVFIQKTAVEKAIPEMDKRLTKEYELRKHARSEGRRYCDPLVLTYQAERMPEQIRLKVGGVTHQQIAVYEEFSRNIPGFMSAKQEQSQTTSQTNQPTSSTPVSTGDLSKMFEKLTPNKTTAGNADECGQIYEKLAHEIDGQFRTMAGAASNNPLVATLRSLWEAVVMARNTKEIVTALALLQKAVEGLLDGLTALPSDTELMIRYRDCHLLVLKALQDPRAYGPQWTNKQVTRCLIECREEYQYNIEAVDVLIRSHLVTMQQYDMHLATSMGNGLNYMAVAFSMQLIQRFCVEDKGSGTAGQESMYQNEFYNTIETLARIATHSRQAPEGLTSLIEAIRQQNDGGLMDRASAGPTSMMHSGISQAREFDDPPGLHDKTEFLLKEWVNLYHSPAAGRDSTRAFSSFVGQMHQQGILKTDELITRFFRLCTEMCTDLCYRALSDPFGPPVVRTKCFYTLDAFVRLIALLVKHSGDTSNTVTKINLLNKVLGIVAGVLLQDHEVRHTEFQQMPYHRIFIMLFIELNAPEHVLENINYQVLTAFCNTFHILRPSKAPGFSYAWLELVSHRVFIGRMLAITPQQRVRQGWNMYAQLLIDLYKFLSPFLRNAELSKPTQLLYRGTLRVLLVLLHDFPEFLCDYHYAFCDVIPPNCIQMRNLILSAFPRNMRLPDPFTPNLKVDMLPEIAHQPRIMTNFANNIQPANFKKDLDSYLKTRSPVTFLSELRSNLQVLEPSMRYNIPLINALVLYVGTQAITHIHSKGLTPSMSTIAHSSHMDIFQNLAVDLDTEGRYLFLNAIANQLRYPNSHTHYFSCTLLYLFAEANNEAIQEQITRVLLERLIVNRPHPWGLLITFIELIKNPQFKFWNHEFVHCAPEIEKLFESVAKSCMQTRQAPLMREDGQPPQQGQQV